MSYQQKMSTLAYQKQLHWVLRVTAVSNRRNLLLNYILSGNTKTKISYSNILQECVFLGSNRMHEIIALRYDDKKNTRSNL